MRRALPLTVLACAAAAAVLVGSCSLALDFDGAIVDAAVDASVGEDGGDAGVAADAAIDAMADATADGRVTCEMPGDDTLSSAGMAPSTNFLADLCRRGDHDFFRFSRVSAAPIRVRVEFDPLQGDLDLRLYSGFSTAPLATAAAPTGDFAELTADPAGSVLIIEVFDDLEAVSNGYRVIITN
ncbi:MAG: hypothetical protein IT370_12575 [Deltaproteobacteria bacterium]|nr:hypothetical protein [Deltaproteobacteria bacterium]